MLAITTMLACIAMADHAVINVQFVGCVLAVIVGIHYYNRPIKGARAIPLPAARIPCDEPERCFGRR